ncbi:MULTISPECIES: FMN-binding protein MioC [unclassified Avibacterium]|uniref:FMN-binding protein MioC n=1 Tax=unclassified Avibacterium TaxID=2685287 RepID=UPI0020267BEA|nr:MULTISPECIES: FMN-binding protein MioC [unclassified Avibacterium]MCW9699186.1 FMN-binding protein MioC [Avibacterium sp. 20-129]MCW9718755.1 FMN-binding protein MioC [Avibacterium sp. 21-599]URL06629.1 FMN-binding protein MioC [Avibacterium sp. 21-595]
MNNKVCLISGSTLGGAEYVAEHLQQVLETQQICTALFHGPHFAEVANEPLWLIVTSTHGAGELPDNLKPLFDEIKLRKPDLSHLRFAVIGLGNSDYDTFCNAVNIVQDHLTEQSAQQICDPLTIDVLAVDDQEQYAEDWIPTFLSHL